MAAVLDRGPIVGEPRAISPDPHRAVLIGVSATVRSVLRPALRAAGFDVVEFAAIGECVERPALIVVEAEHDPRIVSAVRAAFGSADAPAIIGVVGWWSDHEPEVARLTDAVLHVPLRDYQVRAVISAFPLQAGSTGVPVSMMN